MNSEKVVACGMSGRLPESDSLDEFWNHLINKDDLVNRDGRKWDAEYLGLPNGSALIKDLSRFDATFFGMLPKQVNKMEPQLRILLEVAYEAIVDAGYKVQELKGSKTGVYVASSYADASVILTQDMQATDGYGFLSNLPAMLANRVSFVFDFKGPSYTSCAACASGLLVVHNAIKAILDGECDYALACGVTTHLRPQATYSMSQLGVLSPNGQSRPFDESANGLVRADAVVAVFITRESLCRRAYGQLVHSVINHCGYQEEGISFPSRDAQMDLMRRAYDESGTCREDVEFMEAHATATPTGDPIESNAIHGVFANSRSSEKPLLVGSVKSNMGHAECTAGLTSLLKVLLTMNNGIIPPNINFTTPKQSIKGLQDDTLKVVTEPTKYQGGAIGINSFGFGGANAHLIVKPYYVPPQNDSCAIPRILLSSGRTKESVRHNLKYVEDNMTEESVHHLATQVADVSPERMPYRGYKILDNGSNTAEVEKVSTVGDRPVWFIFTGMGSQWPGMGKDLMKVETFRKTILKCHEVIQATDPEIQLIDLIMNGTKEKIEETIPAFVATTSIQIALVNCLKDLGIRPNGLIGHSVGETSCAFADGLITEEQAILATYWRGRCVVDSHVSPGLMASVDLGWQEVEARIPQGAVAACQNAQDNTTISGNENVIEHFVSQLESEGIFARKVNTRNIAYHSPDMYPVAAALQTQLEKIIKIQAPRSQSWISTSVSGNETKTKEKMFTSSYLVNNLVSPVRFYDAVRKIPPNALVMELGPRGLMEALLKRSLHADSVYISLTNRKAPDNLHYFLSQVGKLFNLGLPLELNKLYPPTKYPLGTGTPMLSPGIKWDHSKEWYVPSWEEFMTSTSTDRSVKIKEIDLVEGGLDSFVKDHNIDSRVLYPATGYIVIAWQAIAEMLKTVPENLAVDFSDVKIHRATFIPDSGKVTLTVRVVPSSNLFDISENDEVTVSGRYSLPEEPFIPKEYSKVDGQCYILGREDVYKELRLIGYNYGPKFQGVVKSTLDGNEAILAWNGNWITFLDSMLQVTILGKVNPSRCLYLPTRIQSLRINPKYHTKQTLNSKEISVKVDRVLNSSCSGGVEITGLYTSMAPKKAVKQTVTLERVEFIPYGKMDFSLKGNALEYGSRCREYLLKNVLNGKRVNALNGTDVTEEIQSYLTEDDSGFLKVLFEIGKLHGSNDLEKDVRDIIDSHAFQLANDKLLSYLPKSAACKILLDIVSENSTTRKVKVTELCAKYGGLFIHIIPFMTSQPLVQLEYIATDADVGGLSKAFKSQLEALDVTASHFDINGDGVNGLHHTDLVVARGLAQHSQDLLKSLRNVHSMLNDGGFLLLHEITSNFDLHHGFDNLIFEHTKQGTRSSVTSYLETAEWEEIFNKCGFDIIHEVSDGFASTLFLCRKRRLHTSEDNIFISLSENDFEWVDALKTEMTSLQDTTESGNIWLVSDNDYQSGIVGLVNCLKQEDGGHKIRCIFNSGEKCTSDFEASLMERIVRTDLVMNVLKDGMWGSYRHQYLDKDEFSVRTQDAYVNINTRGDLSSFQWIHSSSTNDHKDPHQVTTTVVYSSLNFKDVMLASGKLPAGSIPDHLAHRECLIGLEFSGYDPRGKRVMGIVPSQGLATRVSTDAELLFDVPETWSLEDAATVPVVYSTVYYALVVRGQVKRGESILIHSGSGGVGQAAIAVALSYGCKVYTTVGTEEKRQFLMKKFPSLTSNCFANSRDVSFEKHVMKETNGAGVNLVLNSLSGEKLEASLRCLSENGRFLEIGKYDLSQDNQIGLSVFLKNTSFHGIHLDNLFERGNQEWSIVANLMKEGLRNGVVIPLPRTVFSRLEVEKAFRYIAKGKHIGKVLIKIRSDEETVKTSAPTVSAKARHTCHPEKVYIIVGGLGGFGLELAEWLVLRDCKRLVLTSRSGVKTGYQARCIRRWESLGVTVTISKLDSSESEECHQLLRQSQEMGPIGGIFNLAMVLKDALLENLTPEDFKDVCKPKIDAANNLDQATRQLCGSELDWFVMFSSVTSGRGNEGQSNYGYANSAMERLCEKRRGDQLPALAIQWGVIGDVGVVADSATGDNTVISGCEAQKIQSCLSTLDLFLSFRHPVLSSFVKAREDTTAATGSHTLDITQFVSKFFGIGDISSVSPDVTLAELGLDSLMAVEVKKTLETDFSVSLSMREIRALSLRKLLNQFGNNTDDSEGNKDNYTQSTVAPLLAISPIISLKTNDCLVRLNSGSNAKPPIFLIHPLEGSIDIFRPLAKALSDYPVYAVQVTKDVPMDSISNMARYYLLNILSVKPEGPYNIVGYSFGALVALEMVLLLQGEQNGTAKPKLMLLDASPNFIRTLTRFILDEKYQLEESHIQALGERGALEVQLLLYLVTLLTELPFDKLKEGLLDKDNYEERLHLAVSTALAVKRNVNQEDMTFSIDSFVKRTLAILAYQPKSTWEMDIVLLKAKSCHEKLLEEVGSQDYGLSKICTGEVKIHTVEGDHEHILQEPGLTKVATIMKDLF